METPGVRNPMLSDGRVGVELANGVSRRQSSVIEKKRNNTVARLRQGESKSAR